jgi:hypothetical protein
MQLISSVIVRLNLEDYDRRSDSGCGDVLGSLTSRKGFIGFWEKYGKYTNHLSHFVTGISRVG